MKKGMMFILFVSLALILFISSFASAGIGDWFKSLFGDQPGLSPFNASVNIQNSPPKIPYVINVSDDYGSSLVNQVDVTEGGASNAYIVFLVDDDNSNANLPSGSITLGNGAGNINLSLHKPAGVKPAIDNFAFANSCFEVNCDSAYCGVAGIGSGIASNQRMYMCNVSTMQFHWEPRNDWFVNVTLTDLGGAKGNNRTKTFEYLAHPAISNSGAIAWTTGISLSSENQLAQQNLVLTNKGNTAHTAVDITAYNLTGDSISSERIPAFVFRADGISGSECNSLIATNMTENSLASVNGFSLDYNSSSSVNIHFCIWKQLNQLGLPFTDTSFSASGNNYPVDGTKTWELTNV